MHYHNRFKPVPWYKRVFTVHNFVIAFIAGCFGVFLIGLFTGLIDGSGHQTQCINGYVFVRNTYDGGLVQMMDEVGKGVRCN